MNLGKRSFLLYAVKFNIAEFHIPLYFEATKKSSICTSAKNGPNSNGATILKLSSLHITNTNIQKNIRNNKCYCEIYDITFFLENIIN